jgi:hypothetical protein
LAAVFTLVREFGPLGAVGVGAFFVLRAWRSGEFLPKALHDVIVEGVRQRYADMADRYAAAAAGQAAWREHAERAARAAEVSQTEHVAIFARMDALQRELGELRDDLRERGAPRDGEPRGDRPAPRRPGSREGA